MAYTRGRCINFDYCTVADSRRDVDVLVGEEFVCPECRKRLRAPPVGPDGTAVAVAAMIGIGALTMVCGGVYLGMRLAESHTPPTPAPLLAAVLAPAKKAAAVPPPSETVLMRIVGSPEMAPLTSALAIAYLTQNGDTEVSRPDKNRGVGQWWISGKRGDHKEAIVLTPNSATEGFEALAGGGTDLVMSVRPVLQSERAALSMPDGAASAFQHPVALDPLALVLNPANRITTLRLPQVRGVLDATTRDWAALGAPAGPIHLFTLPPPSELRDEALGNGAYAGTQNGEPDMAAVAEAVAADPRGAGLVDVPDIGRLRAVTIADGVLRASAPTDAMAVILGKYPLTYPFYFYSTGAVSDGIVQRFLAFAESPPGRAAAEALRLVSPFELPTAPLPPFPSKRLRDFVASASKLAVDFHFEPNSTDLDVEAQYDIGALATWFRGNNVSGARLSLAGFNDNRPGPKLAQQLSERRAAAAAALFNQNGVTLGRAAGFGSESPVGDNNTEEGRILNRRVEIYLLP